MTLYVLYNGTLYVKYPEYVRKGDAIYWVSSESRAHWEYDRSRTAKDAIGRTMTITAGNYIYKVKCTDAGMWPGWKLSALFSTKARGGPEIMGKKYRSWRKWEVIGISEKMVQRRLM